MDDLLLMILNIILPCLAEKAKYIIELKDNIEALKFAIVALEARSADLLNQVKIQETKGLQPLEEVMAWLVHVEVIGPQVCRLLDASSIETQRLCMYGYCSNDFRLTCPYAEKVFKKLKRVELMLSSVPSGILARSGPPPPMLVRDMKVTIGLEKMLEATWERLMKDEVGILGLYGLGGVGKTTLLDQINNKFFERKDDFDVVIFIEVSCDLQVGRIQGEIGKRLGLYNNEWEEKTQTEKASDITNVLTRKRFVILLDDIWRKVDLKEIGIPLPSAENKSKVVFTTRSIEVCGRMGVDEMEVKCLEENDAWELFRMKVGDNTLARDPKIPGLARKVCGKCQGLPLALEIIGETMSRKRTVREWRNASDVMHSYAAEYEEVEEKILAILKYSYNNLKDERLKQCFQYCALFPEDFNIGKDMLIDYWICEGIIKGGEDREKAINQGYEVIGSLVNACLLIDPQIGDYVKMHDVVRQMALWTASKEKFVVQTSANLSCVPEVEDWSVVRRMSLENNKITDITNIPDCPNIVTLFLQLNNLVNISGEFFGSMPKLVVLDLSWNTYLNKLPEEVSNLVSLQYLGLSGTSLKNLPRGLRELVKLRHLGLDYIDNLQSIDEISSLEKLETLKLFCSTPLSLATIEVLELLKNLKVLFVSIKEVYVLERLMNNPRLASCTQGIYLEKFIAVDGISLTSVEGSLCKLEIQGFYIPEIMVTMDTCFQNLKSVIISGVTGLGDLTWLLFAPSVTTLEVRGPSPEMQEIISREKAVGIMNQHSNIIPFPKLQTLRLYSLLELKSIFWEPLVVPCLTMIDISKCPKLKKLPFNTMSSNGNRIRLIVDSDKWLEEVEWEDEAIRDTIYLIS